MFTKNIQPVSEAMMGKIASSQQTSQKGTLTAGVHEPPGMARTNKCQRK